MPHYIYIIGPEFGGDLKIGHSKNPASRIRQLQTSHSEKLHILYQRDIGDKTLAETVEKTVHARLQPFRKQGEWFEISLDKAKHHILEVIDPSSNPYKRESLEKLNLQRVQLNNKLHDMEIVRNKLRQELEDSTNEYYKVLAEYNEVLNKINLI